MKLRENDEQNSFFLPNSLLRKLLKKRNEIIDNNQLTKKLSITCYT